MVKKADLTGPIEPLVVNAHGACVMLDCSLDTLYGLLNTGAIDSYLDGHARKIVVASIRAHVARRCEASKQWQRARDPNPKSRGTIDAI
jgi:hypothetical protein